MCFFPTSFSDLVVSVEPKVSSIICTYRTELDREPDFCLKKKKIACLYMYLNKIFVETYMRNLTVVIAIGRRVQGAEDFFPVVLCIVWILFCYGLVFYHQNSSS